MAIDTENKRKAVINFSIPGAYLLPIPDGTIDVYNRRQMTESYPVEPITIRRGIWVPDQVTSQSWNQDANTTNTWVQDSDSGEDWVPDQEAPEE